MDDNFRVRLDKAFGSLASASSVSPSLSTAPPSSSVSSLWCLTDDEIERIEWNREKDNIEEIETDSFSFKKGIFISHREKSDKDLEFELERDLDHLDDDLDEGHSGASSSQLGKPKPDDYDDEAWEIKNSIGMDCTLDYEEEEDQYDKVAVGKETADDRMYMKGTFDYGIDIDSNNELPCSFKDISRDPRANHMAAKLRLKEDAEAAKKMDSLQVSEQDSTAVVDDQVKASEDGNLKSILKRREDDSDSKSGNDQSDFKSQKRVRFDPECKDDLDEDSDETNDVLMEIDSTDKPLVYPLPPDYPSGIPDYMRNPSKYTHYTFDSSNDVDEQSNRQAYMDFLKMLDNKESQQDDASGDIPKSLTFIPKKKLVDTVKFNNLPNTKQKEDDASKECLNRKGLLVSIAAADTEESENMEEDETETGADRRNSSERRARRYRTKPSLETDESI
ncbi:uncharacterized protein [Euphorbia lathyris]|uniref:uncharacterized protein n=1 Tax=Euphorbia lathyris TaxID=212925 RepID=UPI003314494B